MTTQGFPRSLKRVLVHEGGWSNHPADPGGVTLHGIIQRVYDADRKARKLPTQPLTAKMARDPEWVRERDSIYRRQYWNAVRADELPAGVDYCVFDGAVNSGPVQSVKWLQRALAGAGVYKGDVEGHVGVGTLAAIKEHPDHDALIAEICLQRLAFLQKLRTWGSFGVGWARRVREVKSGAQAWATGSNAPKASPIPSKEMAKGDERDTKVTETPEGKAGTDNAATATNAGVTFTLWTYFDTASMWLSQLSGLPEAWSKWIIGGVLIAAAGAIVWLVGKTIWGWYAVWRDKRRAESEREVQSSLVDKGFSPLPAKVNKRMGL